jgi:hypothetical protein
MKSLSVLAAGAVVVGAGLLASVAISQEGRGGAGMMQGQQGMHGMMQGCPMMSGGMMGGGMMQGRGSSLIPQLPPGNEKLQAQMTAEIMQKAGEIASKYAAQAK